MLGMFQDDYFSPTQCWKHEGIFPWSSLWELDGAPRGKIHKSRGGSPKTGPPGVCNSQASPHRASMVCELQVVSYPFLPPGSLFLVTVILCICPSPHFPGHHCQFALWHQFSDKAKKSYWFSVCSVFFFQVVRTGVINSELFTCLSRNPKCCKWILYIVSYSLCLISVTMTSLQYVNNIILCSKTNIEIYSCYAFK